MSTFNTKTTYLTWRKAEGQRRFVVAKLVEALEGYRFEYLFTDKLNEAKKAGFTGYPAFELCETIYEGDVLSTFARRLVDSSRSDYDKFLRYWNAESYKGSNFALLGLTGAKLHTDTFEFIAPHDEVPARFLTEVAGLHHADESLLDRIKQSQSYEKITLLAEPENEYDPFAVKVLYGGSELGYIKIIHSESVANALQKNHVTAQIRNIIKNGSIKEILLNIEVT
jgi:hypothetical protein